MPLTGSTYVLLKQAADPSQLMKDRWPKPTGVSGSTKTDRANSVAGAMAACALLGLVSFAILFLHKFIPHKIWTRVDIFSFDHYTKEGELPSSVKRSSALHSPSHSSPSPS